MPALVLRNGSEIEIYDGGSAVSPINDRVVYSEETVGALFWTRARTKRGRYIDNTDRIVKELRRKDIKPRTEVR